MECRKKRDRKKQRDFPMAPEKMKVTEDMLPQKQTEIKDMYDIKVGEVNKLITNTLPKENYVAHYRNLKYYLSNVSRYLKQYLSRYIKYCDLSKSHGWSNILILIHKKEWSW